MFQIGISMSDVGIYSTISNHRGIPKPAVVVAGVYYSVIQRHKTKEKQYEHKRQCKTEEQSHKINSNNTRQIL